MHVKVVEMLHSSACKFLNTTKLPGAFPLSPTEVSALDPNRGPNVGLKVQHRHSVHPFSLHLIVQCSGLKVRKLGSHASPLSKQTQEPPLLPSSHLLLVLPPLPYGNHPWFELLNMNYRLKNPSLIETNIKKRDYKQ